MSAYLGQPLNTDEDFLIIKGFAIKRNVPLDPSKGLLLPPSLLSDPTQNRGPEISAGLGVILAVVVLATGARLLIRALHRGLKWGWDDWFILLGSVNTLDRRMHHDKMLTESIGDGGVRVRRSHCGRASGRGREASQGYNLSRVLLFWASTWIAAHSKQQRLLRLFCWLITWYGLDGRRSRDHVSPDSLCDQNLHITVHSTD